MRYFSKKLQGYLDVMNHNAIMDQSQKIVSLREIAVEEKNKLRIFNNEKRLLRRIRNLEERIEEITHKKDTLSRPIELKVGNDRNTLRNNYLAQIEQKKKKENATSLDVRLGRLEKELNRYKRKLDEKRKRLSLMIESENAAYLLGCRIAFKKKGRNHAL